MSSRERRTHTLWLSLIMLLAYVFNSTSNFVRSAEFFFIVSSTHFWSNCATSDAAGRGMSVMVGSCSYVDTAAVYRAGSRRSWICLLASWRACGAIDGHVAIMWIRRSTEVRPSQQYRHQRTRWALTWTNHCILRCMNQGQRGGRHLLA